MSAMEIPPGLLTFIEVRFEVTTAAAGESVRTLPNYLFSARMRDRRRGVVPRDPHVHLCNVCDFTVSCWQSACAIENSARGDILCSTCQQAEREAIKADLADRMQRWRICACGAAARAGHPCIMCGAGGATRHCPCGFYLVGACPTCP